MMMVERVARAICCKSGCWHPEECHYQDRANIEKARAAIASMRDYTPLMGEAYIDYARRRHETFNAPTVPGGWHAMIDAALNEDPAQ